MGNYEGIFGLMMAECKRKENERIERRNRDWKAEGVEWEKASRMAADVSLHA